MDRDEILALLKSQKRSPKKFGVSSVSVFGSVARNRIRQHSDVDLLVEFDQPIGLFELRV
jgi:predicted nucleotidyltransferase